MIVKPAGLSAFAAFLASSLFAADSSTPPPEHDSWTQMIIDAISAAIQWLIGLMLDIVGAIIQRIMAVLPDSLQTDIAAYRDDLQVLNAWIPVDVFSSLLMMYLTWSAIYAGFRWAVRIIRGG